MDATGSLQEKDNVGTWTTMGMAGRTVLYAMITVKQVKVIIN